MKIGGDYMTDYIKREDAIKWFQGMLDHDGSDYDIGVGGCIAAVKRRIPTADVAPVVRCKDCKCWTEWANGTGSCSRFALDWIGTDADDFCSMGERKDDESERD